MGRIIIIVVVIVLVLGCGITFGLRGLGTGNGSGDGNQILDDLTDEKKDEESRIEEAVIKVEENKIYFEGEECANVEDLTEKISKISSQKKDMTYIFEHEYAIKSTYDEVKKTLINLEETLGISIDYRE